jgi:hypothetical protein
MKNIVLLIFPLIILSCAKEHHIKPKEYHVIRTLMPTDITGYGMTLRAEVIQEGSDQLVDYGFIIRDRDYQLDTIYLNKIKPFDVNGYSYRLETYFQPNNPYWINAILIYENYTVRSNQIEIKTRQ